MKRWSSRKHEIEALAVHRGRVEEHTRYESIVADLESREKNMVAEAKQLRQTTLEAQAESSEVTRKLQETEAALDAERRAFKDMNARASSLQISLTSCQAALKKWTTSCTRVERRFKVSKQTWEAKLESLESSNAQQTQQISDLEQEVSELRQQMEYHRETYRLPLMPEFAEHVHAATVQQIKQQVNKSSTQTEGEPAWLRVASFICDNISIVDAISQGLSQSLRKAVFHSVGRDQWSEAIGREHAQAILKRGGKAALASMLLDSPLVAVIVEQLVDALEVRQPMAEEVHRLSVALSKLQKRGVRDGRTEMQAIRELERALSRAKTLHVPARLLAPYQESLSIAQSRAFAVVRVQASARRHYARQALSLQRAAAFSIQAKVLARLRHRTFRAQRKAIQILQASARGRLARNAARARRTELARMQQVQIKAMLRIQNLHAARGFTSWRGWHAETREMQQQHETMKLAVRRMMNAHMSRGFNSWLDWVIEWRRSHPPAPTQKPAGKYSKKAMLKRQSAAAAARREQDMLARLEMRRMPSSASPGSAHPSLSSS